MQIRKNLQANQEAFKAILESSYIETETKCLRKKVTVSLINSWNGWVHSTFSNQSLGPKCLNIRGACGCMHAEPQAILWALQHSNKDETFIMTSTYAPCSSCANLIVASAKISAIAFAHYQDHDMNGLGILTSNNISTLKVDTNIPDIK